MQRGRPTAGYVSFCAGALLAGAVLVDATAQTPRTPQQTADELLAADRQFAAAGANTDVVTALTAMFDNHVAMPLPSTQWAEGIADVTAALRANTDNLTARAAWTPVRAGVSADGTQGFTFGYMKIHKADSAPNQYLYFKYMSYWTRTPKGWRVAAFKRGRSDSTAYSSGAALAMMPAALPPRIVRTSTDAKIVAAHELSLMAAEQSFSDEAQVIGVGPAFRKFGSADAVNMGGGATYVVGAEAISKVVAAEPPAGTPPPPTPFTWKSDRVIVSSSGDLGISFGFIRPHENPDKPLAPFFTIWRRSSPDAPWRYVAE